MHVHSCFSFAEMSQHVVQLFYLCVTFFLLSMYEVQAEKLSLDELVLLARSL